MKTLPERIVDLLDESTGLTDREITDLLGSPSDSPVLIRNATRSLAKRGIVLRARRSDGRIGSMLTDKTVPPTLITTQRNT